MAQVLREWDRSRPRKWFFRALWSSLLPLYPKVHCLRNSWTYTKDNYKSTLTKSLDFLKTGFGITNEVRIMLDGLDECPKEVQAQLIGSLKSLSEAKPNICEIFISCRQGWAWPEVWIERFERLRAPYNQRSWAQHESHRNNDTHHSCGGSQRSYPSTVLWH